MQIIIIEKRLQLNVSIKEIFCVVNKKKERTVKENLYTITHSFFLRLKYIFKFKTIIF